MYRYLLIACTALFLLAGCYNKPVRHLASDACLIKAGESTRQDVLRYLGEPNGHRTVAPGVEEYVYYEDKRNMLERSPVVGNWMDAHGYEMLIVTLTNDQVTNSEFRTFSEADRDWADDFTWEEVK